MIRIIIFVSRTVKYLDYWLGRALAQTGLWVLFGSVSLAQGNINFTHLNTKDGLSSNTINAILKDRQGFMWFGTDDGLNRFDGLKFTVYRKIPNDSLSLPSNEILAIHEDKTGKLWIGTSGGGLSVFNPDSDNFTNFPTGDGPNAIKNNVVNSILSDFRGYIWIATYDGINILDPKTGRISKFNPEKETLFDHVTLVLFEDRDHKIWIGTNEGLFMYEPGKRTFSKFLHNPEDPGSLGSDIVHSIVQDKSGNIWVGTGSGISMLEPNGNAFTNYKHQKASNNTIGNGIVNSLALDDQGNLWIATRTGLDIFNIKTRKFSNYFMSPRNIQGLSGKVATTIYIDRQQICWIGTFRAGINKYDPNLRLFNLVTSNPFDPYSLPAPIVTSFAEADNGKIYVGSDPGGLSLFDPDTRMFTRIPLISKRQNSTGSLSILCLYRSKVHGLVIGTYNDGLFFFNPSNQSYRQMLHGNGSTNLSGNDIFCITEDRYGNLWIGTNGDGIYVIAPSGQIVRRITPAPTLPNDIHWPINAYIRSLLEDKEGNIWIATHGGGIARLKPGNNTIEIFTRLTHELPSDKVSSFLQDKKGNIWIGTFGGGFTLYDPNSNKFVPITEKEGLANNIVFKMVEDDKGLIWMSTNHGISCYDMDTRSFNNYFVHNGLQSNSFVHGSGFKTKKGTLYFGGLEGFNFLNPDIGVKNNNIPPVLFTELRISNQEINPSAKGPIKEHISIAKEINLPYRQSFALSFVSLNFTAPLQNQYAYRLEGYDKTWINLGNNNTVAFTNLNPGKYVLHVKASNNEGIWNEAGASIVIHINPPFWRTMYAYALYVMLAGGILLYIRHKGIQQIKAQFALQQEKMRVEQERREAERIHELDQMKIKFLTNLSHEFRTPISLILGPIDNLISKDTTGQYVGQMQLIKRNARRLLNLVNQLLDFRKMEEQELKINATEGELISFIREVCESFNDLSERKHIALSFHSRIETLHTYFDQDKIERILFNLLSNAFKFTLSGGKIDLSIDWQKNPSEDGKSFIIIRLSDTGIGIPADKQQKIFEHFFQVHNSTSILNQGTGIGLSITQEFIKMLGGKIELESTPGKGSVFMVALPFTPIEQPAVNKLIEDNKEQDIAQETEIITETENIPVTSEALSPLAKSEALPSILLVEDNEDFRFYLKDNLKLHYKVLEAANGKEGWQKALAQHPNLVISDVNMPVMDGIELCRKLKSDKRTKHIPVIMLTALAAEEDHLRGLETGANDYVTKPFNFEVLCARVHNLLDMNNTLKTTYLRQWRVVAPEINVTSADEKLMKTIMTYLEENLTDTQLSVENLSRHVGMSRSSLYSKVLEITGLTPVEFIRTIKLEKAAELLLKTNLTIAEIAYSVGFGTPNYFSKSFKAKYNMLPSEFIAKNKN